MKTTNQRILLHAAQSINNYFFKVIFNTNKMHHIDIWARTSLSINCLIYTVAAANEYWLIAWLGKSYSIKLPIFFALLQGSTWPIQILYYEYVKYTSQKDSDEPKRLITGEMYKSYAFLGILSSFITLSRTLGITALPPWLYILVANTEIIFETIMTKTILRKHVSLYQFASVILVIAGIMVSMYHPNTHSYGANARISKRSLITGLVVSIASRLASSLNTILAERYYSKHNCLFICC